MRYAKICDSETHSVHVRSRPILARVDHSWSVCDLESEKYVMNLRMPKEPAKDGFHSRALTVIAHDQLTTLSA